MPAILRERALPPMAAGRHFSFGVGANNSHGKNFILIARLFFASVIITGELAGQTRQDLGDLISTTNPSSLAEPELRKLYLPVLPIVGYAPANGFIIGAGVAPAILLDSQRHTRLSHALANVQLTSRQQVNFNLRHFVYLSHDRWIFQGDWRVLFFSQPTYGLGIREFAAAFSLNALPLRQAANTDQQPMRFTYIRLYETALRQLRGSWYGGLGVSIDIHRDIEDELLDTDASPPFLTSHYLYARTQGFSPMQYQTAGLHARVVLDTRDNAINAYRGLLLDGTLRSNTTWLGSSSGSQQVNLEVRAYRRLGTHNQILAGWLWGQFLVGGKMPYLALPSIGWDTYNRSGRGYIQGRFRGESLLYSEMEYRFTLSRNGVLGGVTFLNATTVNNELAGDKLFHRLAMGYGGGLRLKVNQETRTNLCMDFGFGANGSSGIYFGIQEVF